VEWTQLFGQVAEHRCHENIDPAQQVALRDYVIEPEFVEKARLLLMLSPHHRRIFPPLILSAGIIVQSVTQTLFRQHRPEADYAASTLLCGGPSRDTGLLL
jgi:hypothetical protein